MNSKQRAYLRAMANTLDPVLLIGKDGIDDNVCKQADDVLEAREIIKVGVLRNCDLDAKEACNILCEATGAHPVQVIGKRFVIYRPSKKDPKIVLPD